MWAQGTMPQTKFELKITGLIIYSLKQPLVIARTMLPHTHTHTHTHTRVKKKKKGAETCPKDLWCMF